MTRAAAAAGLLGVLLAAASCGQEAATAGAGPSVRDSAGIRIVENGDPAWGPGQEWSVDPEPDLVVGVLEGDEALQLSGVVDPVVLSDGTLALGDRGTQEIRAFTPEGALRWRVGGSGEGPGEFMSLARLRVLPGDSVLVWDIQTRRITVLAPDGSLGRSYLPDTPEGATMAAPVALLDGERLLTSGGVSFSAGEGSADERVRPDLAYYLMDLTGNVLDSLFSIPFREMRLRSSPEMMSVQPVPFGRESFVAGGGERIITAPNERVELSVRSPEGTVVQLVRLDQVPRVPGPDDRAAWRDHRLGEVSGADAEAEVRRQVAEAEFPERYPSVGGVLVGPEGHVWVRRWSAPWEENEPGRWWIFDADGAWLGEVETPAGLEVQRITGDVLVGVSRDELDVERVQVHRIRR